MTGTGLSLAGWRTPTPRIYNLYGLPGKLHGVAASFVQSGAKLPINHHWCEVYGQFELFTAWSQGGRHRLVVDRELMCCLSWAQFFKAYRYSIMIYVTTTSYDENKPFRGQNFTGGDFRFRCAQAHPDYFLGECIALIATQWFIGLAAVLEVAYPHERLQYTTEVRCGPLSATEAVEACHLRYTSTMNPVTGICGAAMAN
ncbi:hypothetical protein BDR06DRAFT_553192 [Suillus hirtellus]|nr:hypothetical protein BDR06DRAFT_553192 [Suillus hirtellus]